MNYNLIVTDWISKCDMSQTIIWKHQQQGCARTWCYDSPYMSVCYNENFQSRQSYLLHLKRNAHNCWRQSHHCSISVGKTTWCFEDWDVKRRVCGSLGWSKWIWYAMLEFYCSIYLSNVVQSSDRNPWRSFHTEHSLICTHQPCLEVSAVLYFLIIQQLWSL